MLRAIATLRRIVSLGLVVLAACDEDDPLQPPVPDGSIPSQLAVAGRGTVTDRFTAEVWVHGSTAYTTTWGRRGTQQLPGNAIYIWDVAGATPALSDSVVFTEPDIATLGDVQVSDDGRLLVVPTEAGPGSIVVFDLSNPRRPQRLVRFTSASITAGVHTCEVRRVNGTLYAFLAANRGGSHASRLVIVDLSVPAQPREVLVRDMGNPFLHDVFVRDGLLFAALWSDGLSIFDIGGGGQGGSITNPVLVGNVRTVNGSVHNVWWYHDAQSGQKRYAFVGEEGPAALGSTASGDLHVVDVSDMTRPREVAAFGVDGAGAHNFSVDEERGILYAAFYNGGVQAIDVRGDLGTCEVKDTRSDGRCDLARVGRRLSTGLLDQSIPVYVWGVHFVGQHVYASDMLNGLWKLNAVNR
jgi:hypothetical protein